MPDLKKATDSQLKKMLRSLRYDFSKDHKLNNGLKRMRWMNFIRAKEKEAVEKAKQEVIKEIEEEKLPKNYYFDNSKVERLLQRYVATSCTDNELRDEIMQHADELIRQIIRAHGLQNIYPGKEDSSHGDLFQTAWLQIESVLYKYQPGKAKVFNMWCVNPNTKVLSNHGLTSMKDVLDCDESLFGLNGLKPVLASIRKPKQKTNVVTVQCGYEIESTPEHFLYKLTDNGPEWTQTKELKVGDLLAIQCGQNVYGNDDDISDIVLNEGGEWVAPKEINEELAYLFGLYLSEGSYGSGSFRIYNVDEEVRNFLVNNKLGLKFGWYEKTCANYANCRRLNELFDKLGFVDCHISHDKRIPDRLLRMSKKNIIAMLSGLFDGDGHSTRHNGCVGYTSTSKELINQIKMLLLNIGIITKTSDDDRKIGYFKKNGKTYASKLHGSQVILLPTRYAKRFYEDISFKIKRKQLNISNLKRPKAPIFGLNQQIKELYKAHGPVGKYDLIKKVMKSDFMSIDMAEKLLNIWEKVNKSSIYVKFIKDRINEFNRRENSIVWLPIKEIKQSSSEVCDVEIDSSDHSYVANGFISHNSQVARTVMLAHIKKEGRDRKNSPTYRDSIVRKTTARTVMFDRFINEAREVCGYNFEYLKILNALDQLYANDPKLHEGLVTKLADEADCSKQLVSEFLEVMRIRSHEFSDAPINDRPVISPMLMHGNGDEDE